MSLEHLNRAQAQSFAAARYDGGRGWSIERLRLHFAQRGVIVGWGTVKRWADPVEAERQRKATAARTRVRYRERHGVDVARVFDEDALRRRVAALDSIGLDSAAIAGVIWLDHNVLLTVTRIERVLAGESLTPTLRKVLADAA